MNYKSYYSHYILIIERGKFSFYDSPAMCFFLILYLVFRYNKCKINWITKLKIIDTSITSFLVVFLFKLLWVIFI